MYDVIHTYLHTAGRRHRPMIPARLPFGESESEAGIQI
jgi:hypothetical protein